MSRKTTTGAPAAARPRFTVVDLIGDPAETFNADDADELRQGLVTMFPSGVGTEDVDALIDGLVEAARHGAYAGGFAAGLGVSFRVN